MTKSKRHSHVKSNDTDSGRLPARARVRLKLKHFGEIEGYLFILPKLVFFLALLVIPMCASLYLSLTDWSMLKESSFIGLQNYIRMFSDPVFLHALFNTVRYTITTVPGFAVLSLCLALLFNRTTWGVSVFRACAFVPVITSMTVAATIWLFIYNPNYGLLNAILTKLGIPGVLWLGTPATAPYSVSAVIVWKDLGFYMVIFLAGLQGIPATYYEVALIDGASVWQSFWRVTLPLIRPTLFVVVLMSTIWSFQIFPAPYILTAGGPTYSTLSMVQYVYYNGFQYYHMGYASAIGYFLLLVIAVFSFVQRNLVPGQTWEY